MEEASKNRNKLISSSDYALLKRLLRYAGPFKRQFYISAALALLLSVLGPLRPVLIGRTVDEYILKNNLNGLIILSLLSLIVLLAESFLRYHFIYITNWMGQNIVKNLRMQVFKKTIGFRLGYFDRTPIGISTTRTINDLETINSVFTEGLIQIIADILTIVFVILFMFYENWRLALVSMISFPLIVYATYVFKEGIKSTFQAVRTQVALQNSFLQERITGMKVVQIFNAEKQEYEKFKEINRDHRKAQMKSVWYYSIFFPVVEIITALALALVIWTAAKNILTGYATVGDISAFILFLGMLFRPLRVIADKFNTLQMGFVASDRIFKIIDNDEQIENNGTVDASAIRGEIDFEHVWFAYKDDQWVLKDVSLHINIGETLAIVGATGAGKSSIINILNRFYKIQKGTIRIDNIDGKEYELNSLRKQIGMVQQDVFLFSGSIMENIVLRNHSISKQTVMDAARMLGAHDFIMKLPGQYDYNVMERGATLSLGQRQLISFIRALVYNPKILILDEATSSIDTETEQIIQYAIENLITNRTSIVIAHRLSTIQKADKILVLEKGTIVETGTHAELLAANGYYKKLYDMQFTKEVIG
ncbi:MAG: ABC transporter ATP-binding protein [Chitinophagales bacterium]|nr:ABC transporter ATP-binding protein [Chitinophagales bacterium]